MKFITHNLKISTRIGLAISIPILGMLVFSSIGLSDKVAASSRIGDIEQIAGLAPGIGQTIHELQRERGLSVGFVASKGANQGDRLQTQRKEVDGKMSTLQTSVQALVSGGGAHQLQATIDTANAKLATLPEMRGSVDGLKATPADTAKFYSDSIAGLLAIIDQMTLTETTPQLSKTITAYTQLLHGKERTGQERAIGNGGFSKREFDQPTHRRFVELVAQQSLNLQTFSLFASADENNVLKTVLADPASAEVDRMQTIAASSPFTGNLGDVEAAHWFDTITHKIDLLKTVEDKVAADLIAQIHQAHDETRNALLAYLLSTIVLLTGAIFVAVTIALDISKPLEKIIAAMKAIGGGDYQHVTEGQDRKDEIGHMARMVDIFRDGLVRSEALTQQQKKEQDAKDRRAKVIDGILREFNTEVAEVLQTMAASATELEATSQVMSATAEETAVQASVVSDAVTHMASNMQSVGAATGQLSSAVEVINDRTVNSVHIAEDARDKALRTNRSVETLTQTVAKIGDVVSLINDIAAQTNLLALNATIEAARAGDAGKGFAVVAGEVKNLSNQTARATEEISSQIKAVQQETQAAVGAIGEITEIIAQMSDLAQGVSSSVAEQGLATSEIAENIQQVSGGFDEISSNVEGVNQAAGETGRAAEDVLSAARTVAERANSLRQQVDAFLTNVRAA